jgi:phytoene synthase
MDIDIEKIAGENSKSNFFYSFAFLSANKRYAINKIYAYCQISDEIADSDSPIETKLSNLREWKEELTLGFKNKSHIHLLNETAEVASEFAIPETLLFELLEGMEMDLNNKRYETFADLELYCYKVASVVGLMSAKIFGYSHPETEQYAITLGKALQLTNIIRDVKSDFQMGRIYFPKEDLIKYSLSEENIGTGNMSGNMRDLITEYYDKAISYYNKAETLIHHEDRPNFRVARIMKNIYFCILQEIKKQNFDVFNGNFKLSKFQKIIIALRTIIFDK